MSKKLGLLFVLAALSWAGAAAAQAPTSAPPPPPPYGAPISLEDAKKAAAAAVAEVPKIGSAPDAIAIVDHGGFLVYFERTENTQLGSVEIAIEKARAAALFRRPTKVFEDALAGGRTAILAIHGAVALEGGLPLISAASSLARSAPVAGRRSRTARSRRQVPTPSNSRGDQDFGSLKIWPG